MMPPSRREWTTNYFRTLYGRLYRDYLLPRSQTRREVEFAKSVLELRKKRVLDLACGFGRHARLLSKSNWVWAIDQNHDYLRMAREGLSYRSMQRLALVRGDMRHLPFGDAQFDAVLLLFNSFGYFVEPPSAPHAAERELWRLPNVFYERRLVSEDYGVYRNPEQSHKNIAASNSSPDKTRTAVADQNLLVLQEISRVLKEQGGFLLEVPNPRPLLEAVMETPRRWMISRHFEIVEEYRFDRIRRILSNTTRFSTPELTEEAEYHIRIYTRRELTSMLRKAGFQIAALFGSYDGEEYDPFNSACMIIHAVKTRKTRRCRRVLSQ